MVRINILIFFSICIHLNLNAQNRYVVFFTDKNNSSFSVDQPDQFLSAKAIERRQKQGIIITEQDLPVNESYITEVKNLGAEVYYKSKWMNAILVQTTEQIIADVQNLSVVDSYELVANNSRLTKGSRIDTSEEVEGGEAVDNEFQNNLLGIDLMHSEGYYGEGISMAFMDSGFRGVEKLDLFSNMQIDMAFNFVENDNNIYQSAYQDHGTRVLSTVGAELLDSYQGIAPDATFLLFVTEDLPTEYRIEEYNFLFAAEIADSAGVDIINTSLGYNNEFTNPTMDYTYDEMDGETTIITRAAELAFAKGILVVTSSGNQGNNSDWPYITAPADGPNVLSVGSVSSSGVISSFSSIGPNALGQIKPEVMAYGSSTSVVNFAGVSSSSGTSFASPQIAGLAALLWEENPELSNRELFDLIISLGNRFDNPDNEYGYGIPNYKKAITSVENEKQQLIFYPNPFTSEVKFTSSNEIKSINVFDQLGKNVTIILKTTDQTNYSVNTETWSSGLYIFDVLYTNNQREKLKLLKVR